MVNRSICLILVVNPWIPPCSSSSLFPFPSRVFLKSCLFWPGKEQLFRNPHGLGGRVCFCRHAFPSNQAIKLTESNKERYFSRPQESSCNHFRMSTVMALGKQELLDRKEEIYRKKLINKMELLCHTYRDFIQNYKGALFSLVATELAFI